MKRVDLIKTIEGFGCILVRHGGKHDWYCNPVTGISQPVPRHREIKEGLARHIIKKRAEYRSRPTNIRERVYIYASLRPANQPSAWRQLGKQPGELPTGVIIGTVEVVGCRWDDRQECYAYALRNPKRLRTPLVPRNQPQPGFWRPQF